MFLAALLFPRALRAVRRVADGHRVMQAALGDVDADGDLDAFLVNGGGSAVHEAYVLVNNGAGRFNHDIPLDPWPGDAITLGDINGDGITDAFLGLAGGSIVRYINDGAGRFPEWDYLARPAPMGVSHVQLVLGDLNNNGALDILAAGCCGREAEASPTGAGMPPYSEVWLYDRAGHLEDTYRVEQVSSNGAAMADLDGDGSLDVFLANGRARNVAGKVSVDTPNTVLFNDGLGRLSDSGQQLGQAESLAVALGDVDSDGVPDAAVGNRGRDEIWLNVGRGFFSDSGQRLGGETTAYIVLVDLNGDASLDLLSLGEASGRVWLNDGAGQFTAGQTIRYGHRAPAVGDVTGDGHVDILAADTVTARVWRGDGAGRFSPAPSSAYP